MERHTAEADPPDEVPPRMSREDNRKRERSKEKFCKRGHAVEGHSHTGFFAEARPFGRQKCRDRTREKCAPKVGRRNQLPQAGKEPQRAEMGREQVSAKSHRKAGRHRKTERNKLRLKPGQVLKDRKRKCPGEGEKTDTTGDDIGERRTVERHRKWRREERTCQPDAGEYGRRKDEPKHEGCPIRIDRGRDTRSADISEMSHWEMSNRRIVSAFAAALVLTVTAAGPLFGQDVFTELREAPQVRAFQHVSNGLICQCGCNLVLSTCAHVDCPFAIPVRRFIEDRIREGMPAETILRNMQYGFGPGIARDARVSALQTAGRHDLVKGLVFGFGAKVNAHTSPAIPVLLVLSFSVLALALFFFWRRRTRRPTGAAIGKAKTDPAAGDSPELRDALSRLREREK